MDPPPPSSRSNTNESFSSKKRNMSCFMINLLLLVEGLCKIPFSAVSLINFPVNFPYWNSLFCSILEEMVKSFFYSTTTKAWTSSPPPKGREAAFKLQIKCKLIHLPSVLTHTYLLTELSVCIMLLNPIWSLSPGCRACFFPGL